MTYRKILWAIDVPNIDTLIQRATQCGFGAVCVRTSYTDFADLIPAMKENSIDVLGWRYPPTDPHAAHQQALDTAQIVQLGLDGFIVDPEGDSRSLYNWNHPGLAAVADDYCSTIRQANPTMLFGVTSHYLAAKPYPALPWATFLQYSDAVYPQAYWRADTDHGPISIGTGPSSNYIASLSAWGNIGAAAGKIFPMAGELGSVKGSHEIQQYATAADSNNITELHFYVNDNTVDQFVWDAISQL
ncbi:hypothetical protein [Burkholderia sp. BCC1988]|uniref:hypothetical protein n=1 Tax=Burkholderia sp. BCC1988 TaxID=2817443 RepID=UPI002AB0C11B|nr:hypothetical protein [Burkholderia sp. BCC1988]